MKMNVCDVCMSEGKIAASGWRFTHKRGPESIRLDICAGHRGTMKGKSYDAMLDLALKSEQQLNKLSFGGAA